METRNPNILYCEKCNEREYATVDKHVDAEGETHYASVCFPCKDAILTERNIGRDDSYDDTGEDSIAMDDVKVVHFVDNRGEEPTYETYTYDRFGVGGRY